VSLASLLTEPVSVLPFAPGLEDAYGNPPKTFGDPVPYRGRLEEASESEMLTDEDKQVGHWRLFLPPAAVIGGLDRVTAQGKTFEVDGPPKVHRTPRGPHHIEVQLLLVEF